MVTAENEEFADNVIKTIQRLSILLTALRSIVITAREKDQERILQMKIEA